jgi:hypothetical protein
MSIALLKIGEVRIRLPIHQPNLHSLHSSHYFSKLFIFWRLSKAVILSTLNDLLNSQPYIGIGIIVPIVQKKLRFKVVR